MEAVTVDLDVELLPADGTLTPTSAAPTSTTLAPDLASFFNHTVCVHDLSLCLVAGSSWSR